MKGTFKATWHQSKNEIRIGAGAENDIAELIIEIEEITPENMKKLADSLSEFNVEWL